uniref:Uncharacterized protein n=1 Tax=Parascaris univalens TaxID=6257 RepID=A0A915BFK5_PARUN
MNDSAPEAPLKGDIEYTRIRHFCCIFDCDNSPLHFEENGLRYRACCGLIHVRKLALYLIAIESLMSFGQLIWQMLRGQEIIWNTAHVLGLSVALSTCAFFIAGISQRKLGYLLPHMVVCVITILVLIVQFYIDLLLLADGRDGSDRGKMLTVFLQVSAIVFEVYTAVILWYVFEYICDWLANDELEKTCKAAFDRQLTTSQFKESLSFLHHQHEHTLIPNGALKFSHSTVTM